MNNYEIIKILLDRGATLPTPHDVRCGCDECVTSSDQDSLRHSQSRINAYKALTSSSLIALSSRDPLLTAFELSWELRIRSSPSGHRHPVIAIRSSPTEGRVSSSPGPLSIFLIQLTFPLAKNGGKTGGKGGLRRTGD
jgi:hypothetical protein